MLPHRQKPLDLLDDLTDGLEGGSAVIGADGDAQRGVPDPQVADPVNNGERPQPGPAGDLVGDPGDDPLGCAQ